MPRRASAIRVAVVLAVVVAIVLIAASRPRGASAPGVDAERSAGAGTSEAPPPLAASRRPTDGASAGTPPAGAVAGDGGEAAPGMERTSPVSPLPGASLAGVVLDQATRRPVPGARLSVRKGGTVAGMSVFSSEPPFWDGVTDGNGRFRVDAIPLREIVTFGVTCPGWMPGGRTLMLGDGADGHPPVEILLEAGADVTGRVVDASGRPVEGAVVVALAPRGDDAGEDAVDALEARIGPWGFLGDPGPSTTTDAVGRFTLAGLRPGVTHRFLARTAKRARSAITRPAVVLEAGERRELGDLRLLRPGTLTIEVRDAEGALLEGSRVHTEVPGLDVTPQPGRSPGSHRYDALPPGRHEIWVSCAGHVARLVTAVVPVGEDVEVRVVLERGVSIEGVVVDDVGAAVEGASIQAEPEPEEGGRDGSGSVASRGGAASSDGEGRFRIEGLRPGRHRLTGSAIRQGFASPVPVTAPGTGVRVVLPRVGRLRLRLTVPEGRPPPDAMEIGLEHPTWGKGTGATRAWDGGHVLLSDVAPGAVRIAIRVDGYAPWLHEETLEPGAERDLGVVLLGAGVELVGRVVDAAGAGLEGARIRVPMPGVLDDAVATSRTDGAFRLTGLPPGRRLVFFEAEGHLPEEVDVLLEGVRVSRTIALARAVRVRGRVRSASGAGVSGLRIVVRKAGGAGPGLALAWDATTDELGRFEVDAVPGPHLVEVRDPISDALLRSTGPVSAPAGVPLELTVP